ncbi:hypothetical protein P9112_002985 [Eukaryota sp. TZLM1-RC]
MASTTSPSPAIGPTFDFTHTRWADVRYSHCKREKRRVYKPWPMPSFDRVCQKVHFIAGFYKIDILHKKWAPALRVPVSVCFVHHDRLRSCSLLLKNSASGRLVLSVPITHEQTFESKNGTFFQFAVDDVQFAINFSTLLDGEQFKEEIDRILAHNAFLKKLCSCEPSFVPQPVLEQVKLPPPLRKVFMFSDAVVGDSVPLSQLDSRLRMRERLVQDDIDSTFAAIEKNQGELASKLQDYISDVLLDTLSSVDVLMGTHLVENALESQLPSDMEDSLSS